MSDDEAREALAKLIWETRGELGGTARAAHWDDVPSSPARYSARVTADAILAAGYRPGE